MTNPRIDLQEGHVGRKSGATGGPGEMAYNDAMGDLIKAKLIALSTKPLDIHIWGADFPTGLKGDVFLALHADASTNTGARGFSVGYHGTNRAFATAIEKEYAAATKLPFRGYNYTTNESHYYGFGHGVWGGEALIEFGFRTNPQDRAYMDSHKDFIAEIVARAILKFLNIPIAADVYKQPTKPTGVEPMPTEPKPGIFTDTGGHWLETSGDLKYLKDHGIVGGYADGSLRPNNQPTRAEMFALAARIMRALGVK